MSPRRDPIYLDHHATTPLDERVLEAMLPYLREEFGNAASRTHAFGWRAEAAVESARERLADMLGARDPVGDRLHERRHREQQPGARSASPRPDSRRRHLVTVATEHPSVLDPCRALARRGFAVDVLEVDARGPASRPTPSPARCATTRSLVSVMAANNEIGVLQPIREIAGALP